MQGTKIQATLNKLQDQREVIAPWTKPWRIKHNPLKSRQDCQDQEMKVIEKKEFHFTYVFDI
jgi:hypothetical protein